MPSFIAFDVESPNQQRICSIGITVVKNGIITETLSYLINPECKFNKFTIEKHGIHPEDVIDKPKFDEIWNSIEHLFKNNIVVAHNAPYDLSVLHKTLKAYDLDEPLIRYVCTLDLSIKHVKNISKHGLPELCEYFNIPLIPHDAGSDSCACAELLLRFIKSKADLEEASNIYSPKKEQLSSNSVSHTQEIKIDKWLCDKILSSGVLNFRDVTGKNICLTGNFEICSKEMIKYFLESRGAIIKSAVSKKVDYLIVGECGSESYIDGTRGTKEIKAIELQQNGSKIEIIHEKDFFISEENTK